MLTAIALFLRPFALLFLLGCVLLPIRFAVMRWMPDCYLKRLFLIRVNEPWEGQTSRSPATR